MKKHIRIKANGSKVKKIVCPNGFKSNGKRCVKMTSTEKLARKKAAKKMVRTKNAHAGKQKMAIRAMKKALKKRKAKGL